MGAPTSDSAGIRQITRALRNAGYTLYGVNDGGEVVKVKNENEVVEAVTAVDSATLIVKDADGKRHGVFFVLGNSPEEVAADWHVSLSHVIDPIVFEQWN